MKTKKMVLVLAALMFISLTSFTLVSYNHPETQDEVSLTGCDEDELVLHQQRIHGYYCDDASYIIVNVYYCPSSKRFYANMTYPEKINHMTINKMRDTGNGNAYISYNGCNTYFFYINNSRW